MSCKHENYDPGVRYHKDGSGTPPSWECNKEHWPCEPWMGKDPDDACPLCTDEVEPKDEVKWHTCSEDCPDYEEYMERDWDLEREEEVGHE